LQERRLSRFTRLPASASTNGGLFAALAASLEKPLEYLERETGRARVGSGLHTRDCS
jgi:hypothetical protein